ncbi:MAG: LptA/OstA family protein [Deltaproteobacteria bacterium]|jgi:lipopolysaccharide export system protein LptA|nr:LptA/OstA family protein [Deltaproteobacteria bacterium]
MYSSFSCLRVAFCLCLLALLCAQPEPNPAQAAQTVPAGRTNGSSASKAAITKVTSESMVYNSEARKVTFSGKVKVVHPDFTLTSARLELYLAAPGDSSAAGASGGGKADNNGLPMNAGKVEKIIAHTGVRIALPQNRLATCEKATYTVRDEVLRMDGNPVLFEDSNKLSADVIFFYLTDNRSEAQGNVKVDFESKERK